MNGFIQDMSKTAICFLCFYLLYWAFLRRETFFQLNRIYLLMAIPLSLLIPKLLITSPFWTRRYASPAVIPAVTTGSTPPAAWGVQKIVVVLYLLGLILFLVRFLAHLVRLALIVRRCGIEQYCGARIVFVDRDGTPFSFLNLIFVPRGQLSPPNLRHIIAHEYIHIRQHHSFDIILAELLTIFQWFNPFVWPYTNSLKETHEYLADDGVIAQGFDAARYRVLLFEQHVGAQLFEFANNFKQSQIKRRLTMMTRQKSRGAARLKLLLILPIAALLVLVFAQPRTLAMDTDQPTAQAEKEKKEKEKQIAFTEKQKMIAEKAAQVKQELEQTTDPERKAKLEETLKKLQMMQMELGGPIKVLTKPLPADVKAELMKMEDFEKKVEAKLAGTSDPEKRAELEKVLAETRAKKSQIVMYSASGHLIVGKDVDLAQLSQKLTDMELKIKQKLEMTTDAKEKEMLQQKLADVQAKMKEIQEMKASQKSK